MRITGLVILLCLGLGLADDRVTYEGYKVYKITPKTLEEATVLNSFKSSLYVDFWSEPRALKAPTTVMVAPIFQSEFENQLNSFNVDFTVFIENFQSKILEETFRQSTAPKVNPGDVTFTQYMRHAEINSYLQTLARDHPHLVRLETIGRSYEGREILGLKIYSGANATRKPTILIDAGIHAREWIAPPVALYIIHQLVENRDNIELSQNVEWVVIPTLNPDGYEYTHTNDRMWRKTRSPNTVCYGTDPNRNFGYHWMEVGASSNECAETYAGRQAFSESETSALRDYLHANQDHIRLYLTFHSYGNYILYPWGYTSALPENNAELCALGLKVNDAIRAVTGTTFTIGTSTNILYAAAGGSDDYAKGVTGVELAYTIELTNNFLWGFNPPATKILPLVRETWEGVKAFHEHIEEKFASK